MNHKPSGGEYVVFGRYAQLFVYGEEWRNEIDDLAVIRRARAARA